MQQISNYVFCDDFIANLQLDSKLMPNAYHDYPYMIIKNFLSDSTCSDISNYAYNSSEVEKAKVKTTKPITKLFNIVKPTVNEQIRKTVIHKLPKIFINEYKSSFQKHKSEVEKFFNIAITISTKIQTLEYTKGSFYIKHADDSNELIDKDFNTVGFTLVAPERKLSSVLFTTSNNEYPTSGHSFSGGKLRFNYLYDNEGKQIEISAQAGDMIVFPSNPIFSHEVLHVDDGYRLTLVQWHDGIF